MRMPTPFLTILNHLGATTAGATSVLGVAAVTAGQVPVPTGISPELAAVLISVGPALVWFLTKLLSAFAAYYSSVKTTNRRQAERLLSLALPERGEDSAKFIAMLLSKADEAENKEAALLALRASPNPPPPDEDLKHFPNRKTGS